MKKTNESKAGQRVVVGVGFAIACGLATVSPIGAALGLAFGLTFGGMDGW